jgi:hypothetical protein
MGKLVAFARRLLKLEAAKPAGVTIKLSDGSFFRHPNSVTFFIDAQRAQGEYYATHPLPAPEDDLLSDPSKPRILAAVETGVTHEGARVLELSQALCCWALCHRADLEKLGRDEYAKRYGWPVPVPKTPNESAGAIH